MEPEFDENLYNAQLGEFPPFRAEPKDTKPLAEAALGSSTELMVFEVAGSPFAIRALDLSYHHVLQGVVGEEPFMVSFCGVCHRCFAPSSAKMYFRPWYDAQSELGAGCLRAGRPGQVLNHPPG